MSSVPMIPSSQSLDSGFALQSKDTPEKIRKAASQFEGILIGQILKTSQGDDNEGFLGDSEDQSSSSVMDIANDFFSRSLATKGGFGLANVIASGVEHTSKTSRGTPDTQPVDTPPAE